jgi:hypothetical protein
MLRPSCNEPFHVWKDEAFRQIADMNRSPGDGVCHTPHVHTETLIPPINATGPNPKTLMT